MADSYSRRVSVHQCLGGGPVADVLLWRNKCGGLVVLVCATASWYLFEYAGYNFISFVANVLLLLVVTLFFWAKSASLLNRPLPPLPDLEISEHTVTRIANVLQVWVNRVLSIAHDIAVERDLKRLIQVGLCLWFISLVGSLFNFFTLVYIGVLLLLSVPAVYDKYQDRVDEKLSVALIVIQAQYRKIDDTIRRRIPLLSGKQKKIQ